MKKLIVLFALCLSFNANAAEFIDGMEDVPLMSNIQQLQSNNISFGNDESRFVEAYITGQNTDFRKISTFYKDTLPQLGWKFKGTKNNVLHFERDKEVLDIAQEKASPLLVRITLKSKD